MKWPEMASNAREENDESCYCDFLVIGRTGLGKSTLANKFIGIDPETKSLLEGEEDPKDVIKRWECNENDNPYFETGGGFESVTQRCKVLSNKRSMNRVLDTVGFADSELTRTYGVFLGNIQCFRRILQVQRHCELRFSRVIYFLPARGPLRRADGTLQEEIKVMYDFFDTKIFDIMVIVATKDKENQDWGFTKREINTVEGVFMTAFGKISHSGLPKCPPVIYLPLSADQKQVSDSIIGAPVISDADTLNFSPEFPRNPPRVQLSFENRCTRCAVKIVYQRLRDGTKNPVKVVYENDSEEQYDNSYCHPLFIPKHSTFVRFVGGVGHILTLGTFKLVEWLADGKVRFWPWFFDGQEKCIKCGKPPGSPTCHPVNQSYRVNEDERMTVDHTTKLDTLVEIPSQPNTTVQVDF